MLLEEGIHFTVLPWDWTSGEVKTRVYTMTKNEESMQRLLILHTYKPLERRSVGGGRSRMSKWLRGASDAHDQRRGGRLI